MLRNTILAAVTLALLPAFAIAAVPAKPTTTTKPTTAIARPLKAQKVGLVKTKMLVRHKAALKAKAAVIKS